VRGGGCREEEWAVSFAQCSRHRLWRVELQGLYMPQPSSCCVTSLWGSAAPPALCSCFNTCSLWCCEPLTLPWLLPPQTSTPTLSFTQRSLRPSDCVCCFPLSATRPCTCSPCIWSCRPLALRWWFRIFNTRQHPCFWRLWCECSIDWWWSVWRCINASCRFDVQLWWCQHWLSLWRQQHTSVRR
jgi:hypothetical protein